MATGEGARVSRPVHSSEQKVGIPDIGPICAMALQAFALRAPWRGVGREAKSASLRGPAGGQERMLIDIMPCRDICPRKRRGMLLDRLGLEPILDLCMRPGEEPGAAAAAPVLKCALTCRTLLHVWSYIYPYRHCWIINILSILDRKDSYY